MQIDFVVTWVDGNDPEWLNTYRQYSAVKFGDAREQRFRDWDLLRYWFRCVEKNAPWVRKIFFVTAGHVPSWLDLTNPKLEVVRHDQFIPAEYLPTFSCRPIELNLHRIKGLSDTFVYFNDDMFLLSPACENDFFVNGLPCDTAILDAAYVSGKTSKGKKLLPEEYNSSPVINMVPLNRNFNKRRMIRDNFGKWINLKYGTAMFRTLLLTPWKNITGIKSYHLPYSYLKHSFEDVWEKEYELLHTASGHKFRNSMDVSSRLISYWQLAAGWFSPRSPEVGKYFGITDSENDLNHIVESIRNQSYKLICLNDEYEGEHFEHVKGLIINAFDSAFPAVSSFEKSN